MTAIINKFLDMPYLAQPTKVRVSEYEYMVIPNIAVSVVISVSVAHSFAH